MLQDKNRVWLVTGIVLCFLAVSISYSSAYETRVDLGERYFVSAHNGNDLWSGSIPVQNSVSTDGPFATIPRLLELLQKNRLDSQKPIHIYLDSDSSHFIQKPLTLSGDAHSNLHWSSYSSSSSSNSNSNTHDPLKPSPPADVTSGWQIKTKWVRSGNIWTTQLESIPQKHYFKSLWINSVRATRARTPILHWSAPLSPMSPYGFIYNPAELPKPPTTHLNRVNALVYASWTNSRNYIRSIDASSHTMMFSNPAQWAIGTWEGPNSASGNRYYLENHLSFLDSPGEWFYDEDSALLHLIPFSPKDDPNQSIVTVAISEQIAVLSSVRNVSFTNVKYTYSDFGCNDATVMCDGQSASWENSAAIHLLSCTYVTFSNIILSGTGAYGIWLDTDTNNTLITHSLFTDLGSGGIRIGNSNPNPRNFGNVVTNNYLVNGTKITNSGCGVLLQKSSRNVISSNYISNFNYTGISIGWDWEYSPDSVSGATHNLISDNSISFIGNWDLSDMGCIYSLGNSSGTIVRHNLCHDVFTFNYGAWCMYTDQASSNMTWQNNVCYKTKAAGLHQHFGWGNLFENNILVDGGWENGQPDGGVRTDPDPGTENWFRFERNIVYFSWGDLFWGNWQEQSNTPVRKYELDYNLYYTPNPSSEKYVFGNGVSFQQWNSMGKDVHSIIMQDPLFVNIEKMDFTLKSNSPALKLGFKQVSMQFGPNWKLH